MLKRFILENNKLPTLKDEYENNRIGIWCDIQRKKHKRKEIKNDRIERLEIIPEWKWAKENVVNERISWDDKLECLLKFIEKNNRLPQHRELLDTISIGRWCYLQKERYKNGKLESDRYEKLNEIEIWKRELIKVMNDNLTMDDKYNILLKFINEFNRVPTIKDNYDNINIGYWCGTQKKNYRTISKNKIDALNKISGWKWPKSNVKNLLSWQDNYENLIKFSEKNKRLPTNREKYDSINVGRWCNKLRQDKKKNKLNDEKIKKLENQYFFGNGVKPTQLIKLILGLKAMKF